MKGFVPVDIPTKKYIKAYIISKLGAKPLMIKGSSIAQKLYDILEHTTNERASEFKSKHYTETLRIYIPIRLFRVRGANLNESNVKNFNLFIEDELKDRFHMIMDDMIDILPNFNSNLPVVRKRIGIDIEAWSDDSMKKDYYRYRKYLNKGHYLDKYAGRSFSRNVR